MNHSFVQSRLLVPHFLFEALTVRSGDLFGSLRVPPPSSNT